MGCDIHAYLEYADKDEEQKRFWGIGEEFRLDRNYFLFGLMCKGVRCEPENGFIERGIPSDINWQTSKGYHLSITEKGEGDDECTLERALRWEDENCKLYRHEDGTPYKIEHPDWHSASWLDTEEIKSVLTNFEKEKKYVPYDLDAIHAMMQRLCEHGKYVRFVFWFDN